MMRTLAATIERRILVAYTIDPEAAAAVLPAPFRPDLAFGPAIGGLCMIRMAEARPAGLPAWAGLRTESVAHRMAVEWDTPDGVATGVYVFRRESDSTLAAVLGSMHRATFGVVEGSGRYSVAAQSRDDALSVAFTGSEAESLPPTSVFAGTDSATAFYRCGSVGYSPIRGVRAGELEGWRLDTPPWQGTPLRCDYVQSSFFEDRSRFPKGSVCFDSALLMKRTPARWVPERSSAGTCRHPIPASAR